MNPINILIIDDEKTYVERLMGELKRKDKQNRVGSIIVDNSMLDEQSLEQYDASSHNLKFDIVLIDYQLGCSYTGILVSAWMMLHLKVPRMTLTSGPYPGPKDYFNGHITKDEITDKPNIVINRIIKCVESFNYNSWLEKQYEQLVDNYSKMVSDDNNLIANPCENESLKMLTQLLDKYEKIIDVKQEETIKLKLEYINNKIGFINSEKKFNEEMLNKQRQLQDILKELKNHHA
jgi:hypothetical protein